jgi:hypothetical protein
MAEKTFGTRYNVKNKCRGGFKTRPYRVFYIIYDYGGHGPPYKNYKRKYFIAAAVSLRRHRLESLCHPLIAVWY